MATVVNAADVAVAHALEVAAAPRPARFRRITPAAAQHPSDSIRAALRLPYTRRARFGALVGAKHARDPRLAAFIQAGLEVRTCARMHVRARSCPPAGAAGLLVARGLLSRLPCAST
jgi:hypothetical protein